MRMTWKWIWSVWESSKWKQNHVGFLSAFCKSICLLVVVFQLLSLFSICLRRYFEEVDAFSSKLLSDQRGRGRERGRERREKRKDSGNGLEDQRPSSATMLHPKVWGLSADTDDNVARRVFMWWFIPLTEFRGSDCKKQISQREGAPADTGEHTTCTLVLWRSTALWFLLLIYKNHYGSSLLIQQLSSD